MKQSVLVVGLSRQAQFFGLPLPYAMAAMALTIIPFFILKVIPWLLTGILWYGTARIVTAINPAPQPRSTRHDPVGGGTRSSSALVPGSTWS